MSITVGQTQLQDAVPMTLGQEFDAFHVTVKEDISDAETRYLYERKSEFPGVVITDTSLRTYPYGDLAAQLPGQLLAQLEHLVEGGHLVEAVVEGVLLPDVGQPLHRAQ